MIKTLQWIWQIAYHRGEDRAMYEITAMANYHRSRAEVAFLKAKYEPAQDPDDRMRPEFRKPELSAKEHQAVADALFELERRLIDTGVTPL